jgi:glutamine synthetase
VTGVDEMELNAAGVRIVLGTVVDYSGVTRAKGVPIARLKAFATNGMGASPSWMVFCVDFGIAFTQQLGVVGDLRARIDPSRLIVVDDGIAWAPATLHEQDGSVFAGCPRARLISTLDRLTAAGYTASTGTELEFVLTRPDGTQLDEGPWQGYGIRTALSHGPLLTDLVATFERAGLPLEQIHTEYGRDQIEVSLAPADPLTTADNTVLARILIGRAVARAGYGASFSPVPYAGGVGSGAHLHLSLERGGVPLFSGAVGPYGMASDGGSAIAGIIDWLPELQGVFAGSAVSALRLRPGTWAGAFACWGLENREAAVRFVAATQGNPGGANVEVKAVDGSANPYLVATGLLGAALDGIESKLSLPAEVSGNPAELPAEQRDAFALASDQRTTLDRLEASDRIRDLLGDTITDGVLAVRRYEQRVFGNLNPADIADRFRLAFSC